MADRNVIELRIIVRDDAGSGQKMREERARGGGVVVLKRVDNSGGRGEGSALVNLGLIVAALGEGEELTIGLQMFPHDSADLPETLYPNYSEHTSGEEADGATDQERQLPANAQIVEEFAHSLRLRSRRLSPRW